MNTFRVSVKWAGIILICMFMSGCASQRVASTLKPGGETQLKLGQARFSIISYTDVYEEPIPGMEEYRLTTRQLQERAQVLYPELFSDDWTALPIMVKAEIKHDSSGLNRAAMLSAFTVGIIPFPGTAVTSHKVTTDVRDALGESMANKNVNFDVEFATWVSLLSPFGSLPVPGQADLPRDTVLLGIPLSGEPYAPQKKFGAYNRDIMVEAIVQSLRSADTASLEAAHKARRSHFREVSIDGQTYWSFLAPSISQESGRPVSFVAMLFQEKPDRGTKPYAQVVVARRGESGGWVPVNGYLRNTRKLTTVSTLMEDGAPSRIAVRVVEEPPLEDFIDTPDLTDPGRADNLRWSNGILLEAKNRSLEKLLREESRSTLLGLVIRIEKSILDLNEQAERAKDRAQTKVEKDEGDPGPDRELSILCRQRIEVLKPVLGAIKQEVAARRQEQ
ncbi:MAG: hypothetical protein C4522_17280 [Desulfobacteraceae bacterium]|nr:MAG: hypothetical protein C4522_17280 [Desulfobacteraceae bacterium]